MSETAQALRELEASLAALGRQLDNPRAWHHHLTEAARAVATDANWLAHLISREHLKEGLR